MRLEKGVLISGTGGQGVLAAGEFLSEALFRAGYEVMYTRSYGSEARGGSCRSEVIFSDSEIYDLQVGEIDVLIILSAPALRRYLGRAKRGATVLVDADALTDAGGEEVGGDVELISIPATEIAVGLGNRIVANMVLLGALARRSGFLSLELLRQTVEETMRPSMREVNMRALDAGYGWGQPSSH
jgi:2-oxoglutarate ferredoxin oxidoreductase subunit gamma